MKPQTLVRRPSGDARWNQHTTAEEDARLALLNERIDRSAALLELAVAERTKIMRRAAKRMRRGDCRSLT